MVLNVIFNLFMPELKVAFVSLVKIPFLSNKLIIKIKFPFEFFVDNSMIKVSLMPLLFLSIMKSLNSVAFICGDVAEKEYLAMRSLMDRG